MQNFVNEIEGDDNNNGMRREGRQRETGFLSSHCASNTELISVKNTFGDLIEMRVV